MKVKYTTYIAQSIDGFIATENGDTSWLHNYKVEDENHYNEYYDSTDVVIMGEKTYEVVKAFPIDWPYAGKQSYVLTDKTIDEAEVKSFSGTKEELDEEMASAGLKHAWVMGGAYVVNNYLDVIEEISLFFAPIMLGEGIRLFDHGTKGEWKTQEAQKFGDLALIKYNK